ncbi:hypothetical protein [Chroococcus sp. FPU101]|uniref:hypothetical protein n=1 Tax=Chroococcus sp. FPU101 TaxID=1974212 RepID=UPI001A8CAF44|nr:hypothetical protein [Chroococcus sp. FPU101]GFE71799.1 hypothetical protein CFPU101_44090 [Chroococcus sp. FPU101]
MYKTRTAWEFDWQQCERKRYAIVIEIGEFSNFEEADYFCSYADVRHKPKSDYLAILLTKLDGTIKTYEVRKEQITLYQFTPQSDLSFVIKDDLKIINNDQYEISDLPEQFERQLGQLDYEIEEDDGKVVKFEPVKECVFEPDDHDGPMIYSAFLREQDEKLFELMDEDNDYRKSWV